MTAENPKTLAEVQDALDELSLCNGFWAGELSLLGCATLFDLELDPEDLEALAEALWEDWGPEDLALLDRALLDRPAEAELLSEGDLEVVADRFGADFEDLAAALAVLCDEV